MLKKVKLLRYGVENLNGRIYTKECIEEMLGELDHKSPVLGGFGVDNQPLKLSTVTHYAQNFKIKDDFLIADIKFVDKKHNKMYAKSPDWFHSRFVIRPSFYGTVNSDKTVNIRSIRSFDIIMKNDDAFKGLID